MATSGEERQRPWWEPGVIYQVYPRSFQDTNGDGTGDLPGVIARLDYLQWLGIDAIWLSPVFRSPMADFGYDISDYRDVDPIFGSLGDLDRLIEEAHRRNIRIVLDFVPNHTSDKHPWFLESRSSRTNTKRDWYLWRDPALDGGPPNNWLAVFGGPAWTFDPTTGQYYVHLFLPQQPDLNWRNPEVVAAMHDTVRFWLDRGIDGFRVDVIFLLIKDDQFRDNPPNPSYRAGQPTFGKLRMTHTSDLPDVRETIAGLRGVFDEYEDRVMIGEIYLPPERLVSYYGAGVALPYNFQLIGLAWEPKVIAGAIEHYEELLPPGAWPNWVLGNHDQKRIATRVGPDQARIAGMLLLTLRGTPTVYYGDELGMRDVDIPADERVDPARFDGAGEGRDPERTPMQWTGVAGAGFTTGRPWLPIADDAATVNVEAQRADPTSILTLHRRLLELRRREPALAVGDYGPILATDEVLAYERRHGDRRILVTLNLTAKPATASSRDVGRVLLDSGLARTGERVGPEVGLAPNEGLIIELLAG